MRMKNFHELAKVEFVARKDCRVKAPNGVAGEGVGAILL